MGRGPVAAGFVAALVVVAGTTGSAASSRSAGGLARTLTVRVHAGPSLPAHLRVRVSGASALFPAWRGKPYAEHQEGESHPAAAIPFASPPLAWETTTPRRANAGDSFTVGTVLPGLDSAAGRTFPPDVQLAVGPSSIVEMVNEAVAIWTRGNGAPQRLMTESLGSFFSTTSDDRKSDHVTDPRVLYDPLTGRYFALVFDVTRSETDVAFSTSGDPSAGWRILSVASAGCPDQPRLAVSADLIVFSVDVYRNADCSPGFLGGAVFVLDKQSLLSTGTTSVDRFGPDDRFSGIAPAQPQSALNGMYMVSTNRGSSTVAILYTVTSGSQNEIPVTLVQIGLLRSPPAAAPQAGSPTTLDAGDSRVVNAVWDAGNVWFTSSDACVATGESALRGCGRFEEISTSTSSVVEERDLVLAQGRTLLYPALAVDGSGNMLAVFGYSSPGDPAGLGVVNKPAGAGFDNWQILTAGSSAYMQADQSGRNRWGDYFGAARDPSDPNVVWFAGEYASGPSTWGTTVAAVSAATVKVPSISYSVPSSTTVTQTSATLLGNLNPQGLTTSYWFEYGTTTAYGSTTAQQSLAASTAFQAVSSQATGLAPQTTYHFRLAAANALGTAYGIDQTLTTPAALDTSPPRVVAKPSSYRPGRVSRLLFTVFDNSGEARVTESVYRGSTLIRTIPTDFLKADGRIYYLTWKPPASARGVLRHCARAWDRAGNVSPLRCSVVRPY